MNADGVGHSLSRAPVIVRDSVDFARDSVHVKIVFRYAQRTRRCSRHMLAIAVAIIVITDAVIVFTAPLTAFTVPAISPFL